MRTFVLPLLVDINKDLDNVKDRNQGETNGFQCLNKWVSYPGLGYIIIQLFGIIFLVDV